jgi:hypothetical protein
MVDVESAMAAVGSCGAAAYRWNRDWPSDDCFAERATGDREQSDAGNSECDAVACVFESIDSFDYRECRLRLRG